MKIKNNLTTTKKLNKILVVFEIVVESGCFGRFE